VNRVKWGLRAYDVSDWELVQCTWGSIGVEHGCYVNQIGPLVFAGCLFTDIAGQGVQIVYSRPGTKREHETGLDPHTWYRHVMALREVPTRITSCAFVNCTRGGERASYAISVAGEGFTPGLVVEGSSIVSKFEWVDDDGVARTGRGGISATFADGFELRDSDLFVPNGDRDVVQAWFCGGAEIVNTRFHAQRPVDIRCRPGDPVLIEGCRGNTPVVVSSNPPWVWDGKEGWSEDRVMHRGKISEKWGQ
jgi:hypothetical protein